MATRAKARSPARKPAAAKKAGKAGQPTKYRPEYVEQGYKLALLGLTDVEMAEVWGVVESTIHLWKTKHADFAAALVRGKVVADAEIAVSLYERARGYSHPEVVITSYQGEITQTDVTKHYPPDTQAASIWLRNRRPKLWRSQPDSTDGIDDPPPPAKVVIEVVDGRKPARADAQSPAG